MVASPAEAGGHLALGRPGSAQLVADARQAPGLGVSEQLELSAEGLAIMAAMASMESNIRSDMADLRSELQSEFKADMADLKSELRSEFQSGLAGLRSEFKSDLDGLRLEFKSDLSSFKSELTWHLAYLSLAIASLVVMVATAALAAVGVVFGWWDRLKQVVSAPMAPPGDTVGQSR